MFIIALLLKPGWLLAIQQKHTNYQSPHLRFTNTLQSYSNPFIV
jgi:hypothetical protein